MVVSEVSIGVNTAFPQARIADIKIRVQYDLWNCGPWIVEAARSFVSQGTLPNCQIRQARREHVAIVEKHREEVRQLAETPTSPSATLRQ